MTIHFALGFGFSSQNLNMTAKDFEKFCLFIFSLELALWDWINRVKIAHFIGQHLHSHSTAILL